MENKIFVYQDAVRGSYILMSELYSYLCEAGEPVYKKWVKK